MRLNLLTVLVAGLTVAPLVAADAPIRLMPGASEAEWGQSVGLSGTGTIRISPQATPAEREAARLLVLYVERRFDQKWQIQEADGGRADDGLTVYLGRPKTFAALDKLCREQNLTIPAQPEAYALKVWSAGNRVTAIVAADIGRAVIYGQDTLFQLLGRQGQRLTIQQATIRDWPTIPLRGRPHPHYEYYLKAENFDCMMSSRINFMDLRDGIYAFEAGAKLKLDLLEPIVKRGKDRELRIYAVVNCGVPVEEQDAVIDLFKEFVELGADGLWASFDDKGAGGDAVKMVNRILELGRAHGITGDAIAVTPPKGDYQTIDTPFNRKIIAIPGMEQAVWYWTSVPCAEDLASGEAVGLRVKPSWWHNWPRMSAPSFRGGSQHAYMPALRLADGWNHPNERELRAMGKHVHSVMPWDGWQAQQHYLVPAIGWWSWRPEQYDRDTLRDRMYDMVFGPEQVKTAAHFDDTLKTIRGRFQFWSTQTDYAPQCPPRLKSLDDRTKTEAELAELRSRYAALRSGAVAASLIEPETLEAEYLGALDRELETALAATKAPYPEYWWPAHQDALLNAVYAGDTARADKLIADARPRVLDEVARVEKMLPHVGSIQAYAEWWRNRAAATPADWKKLLDERQAELLERVAEYSRTVAPTSQMLSQMNDPPVQVGTGVWIRHNHLLATVLPEPRETFWGDWIGGLVEHEGEKAAVFALAKHQAVNAGVHSELPVAIPLSGLRDRLGLLVYLADANKESFGLGRAKWRWAGYRSIKLLWGDRELWTADLGIPRLTGEWFVIHLPEIPADLASLNLRLRVEDYYSAKNNLEIVYVGPIHLIEFDRD